MVEEANDKSDERAWRELRLCYDYIVFQRTDDAASRRHVGSIQLILAGAMGWLLFSGVKTEWYIWWGLLALLSIFIIALFYANSVLGRTDKQLSNLQYGIVMGDITSRKQFREMFDSAVPHARKGLDGAMEAYLNGFDKIDTVNQKKGERV